MWEWGPFLAVTCVKCLDRARPKVPRLTKAPTQQCAEFPTECPVRCPSEVPQRGAPVCLSFPTYNEVYISTPERLSSPPLFSDMSHDRKADARRVLPAVPVFVKDDSNAQVVLPAVPLYPQENILDLVMPWCLCGEANVCRCAENVQYEVHGNAHQINEILKCTTTHRARVLASMDAVYELKKRQRAQ
jgi:hypothetical protein